MKNVDQNIRANRNLIECFISGIRDDGLAMKLIQENFDNLANANPNPQMTMIQKTIVLVPKFYAILSHLIIVRSRAIKDGINKPGTKCSFQF